MIIFDLDGTLANCDHRKHFIDKSYITCGFNCTKQKRCLQCLRKLEKDQPNWKAFFEACDQDTPIKPTLEILINCLLSGRKVEIWSGRCESVREKTMIWLNENLYSSYRLKSHLLDDPELKVKMRPIGDYTPDDQLKESWLDEALAKGKTIDFVFDDRPKVVRMWRRRGIFVFDCNQTGEEF